MTNTRCTPFTSVTGRDVPVFAVLMALRGLPVLVTGRRRLRLEKPILDAFVDELEFALLADTHEEVVVGGVGRFWRIDSGLLPLAPEEFAGFSEPGFCKAALASCAPTPPPAGAFAATGV